MLRKKGPLIIWVLTLLFLLSSAGIAGAGPASKDQQNGAKTRFSDVSGTDKNALYINYMANRGLISGFPDGTYHSGEGLTRAQAAVLFCKVRALNPTEEDSTFSDVAGSHWAAGYIAAAVKAGYITGFPDGTYRPEAILTRAQGIDLFLRLATERDSSEEPAALQDLDKNHWAANSLAIALSAGMIEAQDNNIKPEQPFARGDLARALSILMTKDPGLNQQELIGKLKVKNGTVELKRAGSEKAQTINTASIVRKGDTVITGKEGQAEINYPDGSGILLKPNSELIIKTSIGRAYIVKGGKPGTAVEDLQVELTNGKLFGALASKYTGKEETEEEAKETVANNKYSKIASRDKNFGLITAKTSEQPWYKTAEKKKVKVRVDMPWGVAAIRGTFWSNCTSSSGSGMSLLQGDGNLSSGGQTQNLSPGQSSSSGSSGGPPSPPGPMSPSEARDWGQQRDWVGERASDMQDNQGTGGPGSEGQSESEGEGDGEGDKPDSDSLTDTLNQSLDQAAQIAASEPSGGSGGGSSGGNGGGGGYTNPVNSVSISDKGIMITFNNAISSAYIDQTDYWYPVITLSDGNSYKVWVVDGQGEYSLCLHSVEVTGNNTVIISTEGGEADVTYYLTVYRGPQYTDSVYTTSFEWGGDLPPFAWTDLGCTSGIGVSGLSLAVREGVPRVSFINSKGNAEVHRIESGEFGGIWGQVGDFLGSGLSASNIDFGSDGNFYVAVGPPTSGSTQSVELWQYSEGWNSLSPQALGSNSYLPELYLYGSSPHLTYGGNEENGSYFGAVCYYYYDSNDGWCAVRLGDNFYEDELYPMQAVAYTRDEYYSYVAYIANGDLYAKLYFDGWQQMPSSSPAAINVKTVSGVDLALLYGNPVVAYADSGGSLTVMEWGYGVEGYEWQSISPMASEPILIGNSPVRFFVDNNTLYLAYVESDQKVSVMQYYDNDGTWEWSYIGNSLFSDPVATGPGTLDLYVEGGVPYIFYKNANDNRGYVMKGPGE